MEKIFPKGLIIKPKREGAPDFVKGSLSIKVEEFVPFLKQWEKDGWVNIDILKSKEGKTYLTLNTFGRENRESHQIPIIEDGF